MSRRPIRYKMPRNLPRCTRGPHRGSVSGLKFCTCRRCVMVRAIALLRVGVHSDHPGAALTRAFTENA